MIEKVGILGGSFNPIHFGHIHLAIDMLEKRALDHILFCPAALNPHKTESKEMASGEHRLAMLQLAIAEIPQFSVLKNELLRPAPSYTIDTLNELLATAKQESPQRRYFLIVGDDAVANFHLWRRADEIIASVEILVGVRSDLSGNTYFNPDPVINKALRAGVTPTRIFEVSSTEIRARIASGKYCGHLVPAKVLDYIYQNRLYSSSS